MTWWRRDEPSTPSGEERLPSWTAGRRRGEAGEQTPGAPFPPTAAPEEGDVETLVARVLGEVDDTYTPPRRPVAPLERQEPPPEPATTFHVERGGAGAADADRDDAPATAAEDLAWRWRRGQREPQRGTVPPEDHQAVTVRRVAPERRAAATAPPPRRAAPVPAVRVESAPREELERARHRATGAWEQPPEDGGAWTRVAGELRRP